MKVSVITVCYNSAATVANTIESVLEQDYPDVEYIIVDGASTDDTLKIVEGFGNGISRVISEKDKGIYDAINKGVAAASGDVIGLLHSDDFFANSSILSLIISNFGKSTEAIYGDLDYVQRNDTSQVFRHWKSKPYQAGMFLKGWMPAHPTLYVRRSVYDRYGQYNTDFRIAADYEFMLRVIHKYGISVKYIPEVLVKMRVGGESNASFRHRLKANKEDRKAWRVNGLDPGLFTTIRKPLSKLGQFLGK